MTLLLSRFRRVQPPMPNSRIKSIVCRIEDEILVEETVICHADIDYCGGSQWGKTEVCHRGGMRPVLSGRGIP